MDQLSISPGDERKGTCSLLPLYLLAGAAAIAFSHWHRGAPDDGPRFLLAPVAALARVFSGVSFYFREGAGYLGATPAGTAVVIEKSCSGGNFLLILYLLLASTQMRRFSGTGKRLLVLASCGAFSYLTALPASALRIAAGVLLLDVPLGIDPILAHNLIGIATYLAAICISYLGAEKLAGVIKRKGGEGHE